MGLRSRSPLKTSCSAKHLACVCGMPGGYGLCEFEHSASMPTCKVFLERAALKQFPQALCLYVQLFWEIVEGVILSTLRLCRKERVVLLGVG